MIVTENCYWSVAVWFKLLLSVILTAIAMLCKEQGITVIAVCCVFELVIVQQVWYVAPFIWNFSVHVLHFRLIELAEILIKNFEGFTKKTFHKCSFVLHLCLVKSCWSGWFAKRFITNFLAMFICKQFY